MADGSNEGAEGDAEEDTDEIPYTDQDEVSHAPLPQDQCDLLLDAIDAQLSRLQVQNSSHGIEGFSRKNYCINTVHVSRSQSLSRDTGLGSTIPTNDSPISCLDLVCSEKKDLSSEKNSRGRVDTSDQEQRAAYEKEVVLESRREECRWRLERLLGDDACGGVLMGAPCPPAESVCTEDFAMRFRDEMVVGLPDRTTQRLARDRSNNLGQPSTQEVSDSRAALSDTCQKHTEGNKKTPQELSGHRSECSLRSLVTPHRADSQLSVETCSQSFLLPQPATVSGPGTVSSSSGGAGVVTEDRSSVEHEGTRENRSHSSRATTRRLAGVPVWNFDTVTIDSDLESVRTETIRQHINSRPGCLSAIQSVRHMDGLYTDHTDCDIPSQELSDLQVTPVLRASNGPVTSEGDPLRKAHKSRRTTPRSMLSVDDDEETDERCVCRRRQRPNQSAGYHVCARPVSSLEEIRSACIQKEEELATLKQDCEEEERRELRRAELCETELFLTDLRLKRKDAVQELDQLSVGVEQMELERRSQEAGLGHSKAEADSTSCQLRRLQRQRDCCVQEVRNMEEEMAALCKHKRVHTDNSLRSVRMSVIEREELDRQLESAKTKLFAEQRQSRLKLDTVQERLDEAREELQRVTEEERSLRDRCACLEEKHRQKQEQEEAVGLMVCKLQTELGESESRVGALERIVAQKELQLLGLQEEMGALQAQRDGLQEELQSMREQHSISLREIQEQAHIQAEEEKAMALRAQALSHTKHTESVQRHLQMKEEEGRKLREALQEQKEVVRRREEELCAEAQKMMCSTLEQEMKTWEREKEEALQVQSGILKEQGREALETVRGESEMEKRNALALQNKVVKLQTRVQELESESRMQRRKQAVMSESLKEEHQAELRRLHRLMEQEGQMETLRLEQVVRQAEEEAGRLQALLGEREHRHKQATARLEQQLRHWAQELEDECQHLQHLLEHTGTINSSLQLPHSPTVAQAVHILQALREQLQQSVNQLLQELESQRRSTQQLSLDKEQSLRVQREQMLMERDQALGSLKERLIKDHIEELSGLQRAQVWEGGEETGSVVASLRRQLQAKDQELRLVQRSMGQWKEQMIARLACKFEAELTSELARKAPKAQEEKQRKLEKLEEEMRHVIETCSMSGAQQSASSPSLHMRRPHAPPGPSDMASFKLLHHLQGRVKQLRAENQAHSFSPTLLGNALPGRSPMELAGSYLETIPLSQDCSQFWKLSCSRTVQS